MGSVFSEDSCTGRGITAEEVALPDSPGTVLLNETITDLTAAELAGVLFALVRDCAAFRPSPDAATVIIFDGAVELQFDHKHLRLQFHCADLDDVVWPTVRDQLGDLPSGTEWLVLVTGSLSTRAKAEIEHSNYRAGVHYIEVPRRLRWRERG